MNIQDLKNKIVSKSLSDEVLILKYEDNKFLCYQYINEISKYKNKEKIFIEKISDIDTESFVSKNILYILDIDELKEIIPNNINNLIIVCNKINENVKFEFVEVPKLIDWQIKDYISLKLPGLNEKDRDKIFNLTQNNIYRLDNEINKISIFNKDFQKYIFEKINEDNGYVDLDTFNIFELSNAIIKRDISLISDLMNKISYSNIEPMALVSILHKNFLNLINIQIGIKTTPESLGLSYKQFKAIEYNCNKYTNNQLIKILEFLNDIDVNIKSGKLDFNTINSTNYIISNIV